MISDAVLANTVTCQFCRTRNSITTIEIKVKGQIEERFACFKCLNPEGKPITNDFRRIKPNEKCHCGTGIKFKKCCGKNK